MLSVGYLASKFLNNKQTILAVTGGNIHGQSKPSSDKLILALLLGSIEHSLP